jgi:hypothetical protein
MIVDASEIEKYDEVLDFLMDMIQKYDDFDVSLSLNGKVMAKMQKYNKEVHGNVE